MEFIMIDEKRLTSKEVAQMFKINGSTLRSWRRYRRFDKRYPRFHKLFTGKVYYLEAEILEDMKIMEVEAGVMEMIL